MKQRLAIPGGLWGAACAIALAAAPWPAWAAEALTLEEAIRAGLAASPELKQASAEVEKAQVGLTGAQAERISYSSDIAIGDRYGVLGLFGSQPPVTANTPIANGMVMARVPLFTGFRLTNQIGQAEAALAMTRARAETARQDLIWTITEAYWQAHRARLRARIQQDAVEQAQKSRDVVKASFAIGSATGNELDRVEVALLNQEADLLKAQGEAQTATDRLATLLQRDLEAITLAAPPAPGALKLVAAPLAPSAELLESRPDVRAAKSALAVQEAGLAVAQADRWPQLDLISAYQHGNNPFIATSQNYDVLSSFVGTWDARLNLSVHLFDHGVISRNIERAAADVEAARQALEAVRRKAELEVRQAQRNLELAKRRIELGERSEKLAQANLKWLEGRFKFGYALPVELNEARVNLITSRNQRVDAQIDYQMAQAALARALGRLDVSGAAWRVPDADQLRKVPAAPERQ